MAIPKVYKALVRRDDGTLVSLIARKEWAGDQLEYREGEITYAPEGSMGIFVAATLEGAKCVGHRNSGGKPIIIHEVTPLGEMLTKRDTRHFAERDRYPAILLGGEVYSEEAEPEPEEKLVDVSAECVGDLYSAKDGCLLRVFHNGNYVFEVGNGGKPWVASEYEVKTVKNPVGGDLNWFKVFKKGR